MRVKGRTQPAPSLNVDYVHVSLNAVGAGCAQINVALSLYRDRAQTANASAWRRCRALGIRVILLEVGGRTMLDRADRRLRSAPSRELPRHRT
jgi:hypothetical protein